jgi:diacylglycerol kinase family enzyme
MNRRLLAAVALVLGSATIALAVAIAVDRFPRGLSVLVCLTAALAFAWHGIRRRGPHRVVGLAAAALLVALSFVVIALEGSVLLNVLVLAGVALTAAAGGAAFATHADLPSAPRPARPVLFMNPRSGGGKATRFHLADEADARGIDAVELEPGDDLWELVRGAVDRGADALAMAGGDGSQAIVAAVAAEHGLPYACIPAGTRNHFALDLGVDRDDVVGALDAFVDGRERVVDLADVNGRVFVNNVSLGLYAEAVQRAGYRDAKVRTILETVPDAVGPDGRPLDLRWTDPDGDSHRTGATILVSNNRYRLGRLIGSGTRPRMDEHLLGVAVVDTPGDNDGHPLREWSTDLFEVESGAPVPAGIDGEAVKLAPPVRFRSRPAALRVRIALAHPGASPSAAIPDGLWHGIRALFAIAGGHASARSAH